MIVKVLAFAGVHKFGVTIIMSDYVRIVDIEASAEHEFGTRSSPVLNESDNDTLWSATIENAITLQICVYA